MARTKKKDLTDAVDAPNAETLKAATPDGNKYRNRIVRFEFIKAGELGSHEGNFRLHPGIQSDAMRGMLSEVGWVNAVLAFEEDGRLVLFDGHLRKDLEPDDQIPVIVTDLTRAEADLVLATHDFITSLAEVDEAKLTSLTKDIDANDASVRSLIATLEGEDAQGDDEESGDELDGSECKGIDLLPHEHYDYVVVLARTTQEWGVLVELLGLEEVRDVKVRNKKMGVGLGRAVEAGKLIEILRAAMGVGT